jgi:hypothetical protein
MELSLMGLENLLGLQRGGLGSRKRCDARKNAAAFSGSRRAGLRASPVFNIQALPMPATALILYVVTFVPPI